MFPHVIKNMLTNLPNPPWQQAAPFSTPYSLQLHMYIFRAWLEIYGKPEYKKDLREEWRMRG